MSKTANLKKVSEYLRGVGFIDFALIFGSFSNNKSTEMSDLDLGIYTKEKLSLIELGKIINKIEHLTSLKVDVIILNEVFKTNPEFAFNVISQHQLLFCEEEETFINFKKNTFLYYSDTIYLRNLVNNKFYDRLVKGNFGKRNYVG